MFENGNIAAIVVELFCGREDKLLKEKPKVSVLHKKALYNVLVFLPLDAARAVTDFAVFICHFGSGSEQAVLSLCQLDY